MDDSPSSADSERVPLVAIGGAAGGPAALARLLEHLGADIAAALVVLLPVDPPPVGLPAWLAPHARLPVHAAVDGQRLARGAVYCVPADHEAELDGDRLRLHPAPQSGLRLPIDRLLLSVAECAAERAVAVLLSGTGDDGGQGLRAVQGAGGLTLAQSPLEAEYASMPASAIRAGGVDRALPLVELAEMLRSWAVGPPLRFSDLEDQRDYDPFTAIVAYAGATLRRDLRVYKPSTVRRRILRRMALLNIEEPESYLAHLGRHADESERLAEQLLVDVTEFFRDRDAFDALDGQLEALVAGRRGRDIRVWVPGCASGEEAYSIAMLLSERLAVRADEAPGFQIFATDLSVRALGRARAGVYPASIERSIPGAQLARYFAPDGDGWQVRPWLRDRVTFARHDLVFDPPFSRMDLVSCRNLLIYLEPTAQLKAFQLLHFALQPGGLLFLGSAENPPPTVADLFEAVDRNFRLFRQVPAVEGGRVPPVAYTAPTWRGAAVGMRAIHGETQRSVIERLILDVAVDAAALVDASLTVLYTHGEIDRYLRYPRGLPTTGLAGALPPACGARIRAATQAVLDGESGGLLLDVPGHRDERIRVQVLPANLEQGRQALLCFHPGGVSPAQSVGDGDAELRAELDRIEREMNLLVEQLQTSNEDLRASNEEVLSMNEELQSSNEELETSKEELQSMNEELTTVNAQLQAKLQELEEANADLSNFVTASRIATLFLDRDLRIRRFTPEARAIFRLVPGDVGRHLADIRHALEGIDLDGLIGHVVESGEVVEREAKGPGGRWFLARVLPYRMRDGLGMAGVMLTFVDITHQKRREQEARAFQRRLRFTLQDSPITAFTQDAALRYTEIVNARGEPEERFIGVSDDDLDYGPEWPILRDFKREVLATGVPGRRRVRLELPGEGPRVLDVRARRAPERDDELMVVAIDVTDALAEQAREQSDAEARISRQLSRNYLESLGLLAGGVAHDFNNHLMVMQASLDLMRDERAVSDELFDEIDLAMRASRELIAQILAFAQPEAAPVEPLSLGEIVAHTAALIRPVVPPGVEMIVRRDAEQDVVLGSFSRVQQAVTNLVHNAIHAMPDGGTVTVRVTDEPAWVVLEVRDTGVGIPPEVLGRVFEPFYTTRSRAEGSGMGLAVVHGVVRGMGGEVDVQSAVGVGSVFTLRLPHAEGEPAVVGGHGPHRARDDHGVGQRIAVVDDEAAVARAVGRTLAARGFRVTRFTAGARLLAAMESGVRFDAVISDIVMPHLDGPSTVEAARRIEPGLPVVLLSGFSGSLDPQRLEALGDPPCLRKPVKSEALIEALVAVLDPPSDAPAEAPEPEPDR